METDEAYSGSSEEDDSHLHRSDGCQAAAPGVDDAPGTFVFGAGKEAGGGGPVGRYAARGGSQGIPGVAAIKSAPGAFTFGAAEAAGGGSVGGHAAMGGSRSVPGVAGVDSSPRTFAFGAGMEARGGPFGGGSVGGGIRENPIDAVGATTSRETSARAFSPPLRVGPAEEVTTAAASAARTTAAPRTPASPPQGAPEPVRGNAGGEAGARTPTAEDFVAAGAAAGAAPAATVTAAAKVEVAAAGAQAGGEEAMEQEVQAQAAADGDKVRDYQLPPPSPAAGTIYLPFFLLS